MADFFYLIPIALALGLIGLGAFMWSLKAGQYDDLDGAAERILFEDDDGPAPADASSEIRAVDGRRESAASEESTPRSAD